MEGEAGAGAVIILEVAPMLKRIQGRVQTRTHVVLSPTRVLESTLLLVLVHTRNNEQQYIERVTPYKVAGESAHVHSRPSQDNDSQEALPYRIRG